MNRAMRRAGDPATARVEAYAAMKALMLSRLREFYTAHPDFLLDERSNRAVEESLAGLKGLYDILDGYDIQWRSEDTPVP